MLCRGLLAVLFVALPLLSACSDDGGADGPAASVTTTSSRPSTTSSSVALTPEQEVEAAYLRSWDVYAKAVRELDPAGLAEAFAGTALELRIDEVRDLAAANTPVRIEVDHDHIVDVLDGGRRAVVLDSYTNHSVLLDPRSGEPSEPDPNEVVRRQYTLELIGETWKVVDVLER